MEKSEVEKVCHGIEDGGQLIRSRSLKTKQLVRSQAIRESQSPPRTCSPIALSPEPRKGVTKLASERSPNGSGDASDASSHASDVSCSDRRDNDRKKQSVEIQITHGAWESEIHSEQRQRAQRWLGQRDHSDSSRDLLSNNPRVACVCGTCGACPHCRGRRRKPICPTKQDSGIVCSDECPDCSDSEQIGNSKDGAKKSASLDIDDTYYCRCPERKEKPKNITLSRTDSDDKLEPTGPELVHFIKETLNKNSRDRLTLLKIEKELHNLVNDTGRCIVRFPVMTSYGRMLVHRCAALFQLSHHIDQANKTCVLVSKTGTSGGRIPCTSFKEWCTATFPPSPQHQRDETLAKSILKRSTAAGEDICGAVGGAARSKSLEQREREYERVRRRIFSSDNCAQDESQWPWLNSGPVKLLTSEGRNKLLKVQSLESRGCEPPPRVRGVVSKSHSFGGYAADSPNHRLLSKQGDLASSSWRLSPSSSGYKTLSLRSTDSVTPSPTGGASPEPGIESGTLVWAVTDLSSVPPGALVIHPQTGRPLTNPDGSLYHFDPANPPIIHDAGVYLQNDQFKNDPNNEKRRGRLEKQHSFIDNECECQPPDECRSKCYCEGRRQDPVDKNAQEKAPIQPEEKQNSIPSSPSKNRFEQNATANTINIDTTNSAQFEQTEPVQTSPQYEEQKPEVDPQPPYETQIQKVVYEPTDHPRVYENHRPYDHNQRSYEAPIQKQFENQYSSPNHRTPSLEQQKAFENANQRNNEALAHRFVNKMGPEVQDMTPYIAHTNYIQGYRNDEMTSPPQAIPNPAFMQADMSNIHNVMLQTKVTPVPIPDPNIRPLSLTNVMYPAPMPQGYSFVPNPCRLEPPMQPIYQQMIPQQPEEPKPLPTSPHNNDSTFRIDPSYPYAADFSAACGACAGTCDPAAMQHQHRGYNVAYGQVEMPQYPVGNVILPPQIPHYPVGQYQEPVQWSVPSVAPPKLLVQELYPVVYPNMYPPYNVVYPPVIQQPYPLCQPVYPVIEKQAEPPRRNSVTSNHRLSKHNSVAGSARNTPDEKPQFEDKSVNREVANPVPNRDMNRNLNRQNSNEIAVKIQQIKEQMAQVNTRDNDRPYKRDEWKRRNSGSGILGNYPINNHFNGRVMGRPNEDTQLSSAARAIVNSIRNMQARNNYHQDARRTFDYTSQYHRHDNRHDNQYRNRQRPEREQDNKSTEKPINTYNQKRTGESFDGKSEGERRFDGMHRNRNLNPLQFQYRPPYLFRQMSPGAWCRRSPGPVHPVLGHPRRPHPDTRNGRR
ncbi:cAMP-regulated phosphoprotein 21 [Battus philenor]|uniref:cAMP-regulated phosphoprotein 21 n=1 Tax=Battus philenor TaxID=42288 RepID=UPI0035CEFA43